MRTIADQTFVTERLVQLYPALKPVVTTHPAFLTEISSPSCFEALAQAIVHQRISMTVGRAIMQRLCQFCNDQVIPSRIIEASNEDLQQIGLSRQKRGYLLDLAARFELNPDWENRLALQPDDDVINVLTQIKGIGKWSVEMFLMFHLKLPDVWPVTDLGI